MPSSLNQGGKAHNFVFGRAGRQKKGVVRITKYAVLRLEPQTAPASCSLGDFYMSSVDSKVRVCTTAGTPGTWTVVGAQT